MKYLSKIILVFFIILTSCLSNNLKENDTFSYKKDLNLTTQEIQWLKNKEYLTVGSLSSFAPFNFIDSNTPTGYSIEYMKIVGKILNKEIRFVNEPWAKLLTMLKNAELDIIPDLAINEERKKYLDFTNFEHIIYSIGFAVKKNEVIESMSDLKDKKIAVVKQTFLHTFFKKNFPSQPLYIADNTEDALWALLNDKASVLAGNNPSLNYYINKNWIVNLKIIKIKDSGLPDKISLPMGITKGNDILKSILEKVNLYIPLETKKNLKNEWLVETKVDEEKGFLTRKEKEFIKKHKKIKFLVRASRPPFEFDDNGLARGIAVDYIELICQKIGIEAEFIIKKQSLKDTLEELPKQDKEYDTILFLVKNQDRAKKVEFGIPYISYPMMIITNVDGSYVGKTSDLNGKKVALEQGYLTNIWIKRDYPDIKIVPVKTTIDALKMVNNGQVEAYIGNMAVANYMSVNGSFKNIKISAPSDYGNIDYSFVAPKNLKELVTILSKGYLSISPSEHNLIQQKWFSVQTIERIDYSLVWKIVAGAILIIGWILWWNKKIQNSKKEFQTIFETSKDAIAITDLNTKFLNFNDAYMELTGLCKNELLKRTCLELTIEEDKRIVKDAINNTIKKGFFKNLEEKYNINGKEIDVSINISLLPDKKRLLIMARDISVLKAIEQQNKMASLGEMLANIAHQWRQPLSIISTSATGLKLKEELGVLDNDTVKDYCDIINENAQFLSNTIEDFRNFLSNKRMHKYFNLKENISYFRKLIESSLIHSEIEFIVDVEEDIFLNGYPNELIQCYMNIFNNAKYAYEQNEIETKLFFIFVKKKETDIEIIFRDNAGGINKDILERIFEPYFTTKHKTIGTGLGLHMTYKLIVEGMNGQINSNNVQYNYNKKQQIGAEFIIKIPV